MFRGHAVSSAHRARGLPSEPSVDFYLRATARTVKDVLLIFIATCVVARVSLGILNMTTAKYTLGMMSWI